MRAVLEKCLASLDNGKHCLTYCSGMAAITSVLQLFKNGDHFIAGEDIYGTTALYMRKVSLEFELDFEGQDTISDVYYFSFIIIFR